MPQTFYLILNFLNDGKVIYVVSFSFGETKSTSLLSCEVYLNIFLSRNVKLMTTMMPNYFIIEKCSERFDAVYEPLH